MTLDKARCVGVFSVEPFTYANSEGVGDGVAIVVHVAAHHTDDTVQYALAPLLLDLDQAKDLIARIDQALAPKPRRRWRR